MGQGNADTAEQQHAEALRHPREQMAEDEKGKDDDQQLAPLDVARQQHHRQRGQGHHPGVDGQHQANLGGRHVETAADVAEQRHRDEFGGVENEGRQGQGDDTQPTAGSRIHGCIHE
ncbi:hypothetical protein D3C79_903590 [compost metagenome]